MRKLLTAGALGMVGGVLALALAACGGSSISSANLKKLQRQADLYQIFQLERVWHRATSKQNVNLMMSIWAPNGTLTEGPGETVVGKAEIRQFFLTKAAPFQPQNHWVSDTPAYKIRTTLNGDKGTVYFECHFLDAKTGKVAALVGAHLDIEKVGGRWLITKDVGGSPTLTP